MKRSGVCHYLSILIHLTVLACLGQHALAQNQRNLSIASSASNEQRVALIIGNSAYKDSPLKNPVNDAQDMANVLTELGFKVTLRQDANQRTMKQAIRDFGNELKKGGVGLFFFAGHGVQSRGRNFLLPVGADIQNEYELEDQAVDGNLILGSMEDAQNRINIVILDACRNNPFARSFRSAARGLAQMDAAKGTVVAFSTAPGSVAADGDGRNGIYTKHLLASLRDPESRIEDVFQRVRAAVVEETGSKQVPWESSSLVGRFYFVPGAELASKPSAPVPQSAVADRNAIDLAFWNSMKGSSDQADFEAYLRRFPDGQFAELARNRTKPVASNRQPSLSGPATRSAEMKTNLGAIVIELYPEKSPKSVANFVQYVKDGFYAGTLFHRVIDGFMIQGGGYGREYRQKQTRAPIENEASNGLRNEAGTLAMARTSNPNSATAQFFINLASNTFLDFHDPSPQGIGYAVFGRVTRGMDVVTRIARTPTGPGGPFPKDVPQQPVIIESITLISDK